MISSFDMDKYHTPELIALEKKVKSDKVHQRYLAKRFGLSVEQYEYAVESQKGLCKICDKPAPEGQRLAVFRFLDKNRALVCRRCLMALEFFNTDPALILRASQFIEFQIGLDKDIDKSTKS